MIFTNINLIKKFIWQIYDKSHTICQSFISKGAPNAIVKLIESGAEIQQVNNAGNTALHGASTSGKSLAVEILISRGADCEAQNHYGQSPIFGAAKNGNLSTVKKGVQYLKSKYFS